jgi:hypothetical protein
MSNFLEIRGTISEGYFTLSRDRDALVLGLDQPYSSIKASKSDEFSEVKVKTQKDILGYREWYFRLLDGLFPVLGAMRYRKKLHPLAYLQQVPVNNREIVVLQEQAWVKKPIINTLVGGAIAVQAVATYIDVDHGDNPAAIGFTNLSMVVCFAMFWVEFLMWFGCVGMEYFGHSWFQFDFLMLVAMTADVYYVNVMAGVAADSNDAASMYRALRVFRVFRILKALHTLQMVEGAQQLFILLATLMRSMTSVLRIFALAIPLVWGLAVCMTEWGFLLQGQGIKYKIGDDKYDSWREWYAFFGSTGHSSFAIIQAATRDHWSALSRMLLRVDPKMAWVLLVGQTVFWLIYFNLITAILIEKTLEVASKREALILKHEQEAERAIMAEMQKEFSQGDEDGSGELSWSEFNELVNSRHMVKRLQMLEIPLDDIGDLFRMCDTDGGGTITVQEFVEGVKKLRGHASARDLCAANSKVRFLLNRLMDCSAKLDHIIRLLDTVNKRVDDWWSLHERKFFAKDYKLSQRRMWFTRSKCKTDVIRASEFDLEAVKEAFGVPTERELEEARRQVPVPPKAKATPKPPSGKPADLLSRVREARAAGSA